jgi:hypothetical protein
MVVLHGTLVPNVHSAFGVDRLSDDDLCINFIFLRRSVNPDAGEAGCASGIFVPVAGLVDFVAFDFMVE